MQNRATRQKRKKRRTTLGKLQDPSLEFERIQLKISRNIREDFPFENS